jgi:hypothetical protein
VGASGAPPLSFQWRFNGIEIAGATNRTFTVNSVTTNDLGEYAVVVSNPATSVMSQPAILSFFPSPDVTLTTPVNGTRYPIGAPVTVTANATNEGGIGVRVEFLIGQIVAGVISNAPFSILLTNLSVGTHILTARPINDFNVPGSSKSVQISMHDPPEISIIYPTNHSVFATNTTTTMVLVSGATGLTGSTTYRWHVFIPR